jgi:protein phosphatase
VLQRSIGVTEDVEIDVRGPFELQEGDIFILCSDGLHGLVKEGEMKQVATSMPIHQAGDEFVKLAIERGAPDNVTVIVAKIERAPDGDATIIDDPHMDDTQDIDPAAFDETVREADPATGNRQPATASGGMSPVRWLLLLVLFLGAAGAWLLFSR